MPGRLRSGAPTAPGGYRKNAGRKTDEFKKKCAELCGSPRFFSWAKKVFDGDDVEPRIDGGRVIMIPASVDSRMHLWEKLAAYGFGKPSQNFEFGDGVFVGVLKVPEKSLGAAGGVQEN